MTINSRCSHLVPPFTKNTNIFWGDEGLDEILTCQEFLAFNDEVKKKCSNTFDSSCKNENKLHTNYNSRKRHSNGSIIHKKEQLYSTLPPLPTMESFLTMMNMPSPPELPDLTARSTSSSASSSHSTINSLLLDDVSVRLAKVNLDSHSPLGKKEDHTPFNKPSKAISSKAPVLPAPPPVPPKDFCLLEMSSSSTNKFMKYINTHTDYRNEKSKLVLNEATSKKRRTTDMPKAGKKLLRAKSAQKRPPIPPRRSSMPSDVTTEQTDLSKLPFDATTQYRKPIPKPFDTSRREELSTISRKNNNNEAAKQTNMLDKSKEESKKSRKSDNKLLKLTENDQVVLLYEMIEGKLQVVAGTPQKLFEKLADEAVQDIEFVDTYLLNHFSFGDFKNDKKLQQRLDLFRFSDSVRLFQYQSDKINFALEAKTGKTSKAASLPFPIDSSFWDENYQPSIPQYIASRRLSDGLFSFESFDALSLTLTSPSLIDNKYHARFNLNSSHESLMSLDTKDVARYLTLADYQLFKSIHEHGIYNRKTSNSSIKTDHVQLMTKRANMLGHWVAHELCNLACLKPKRSFVKKLIDIAKMCYELNNFHTCMVITMGLESTPKLKEVWESLSNKDSSTFSLLQKLLDVNMNMRCYRQKIKQAKSPAIPFLPVVLKDYTFLNENPTFLSSYPDLINFSKFIFIKQFTDKTFGLLEEPYWFSGDLSHFPFLQQNQDKTAKGSLDDAANWVESRLDQVQNCYLHCDLLCNNNRAK
ncbi:Rap guanine nucleotide exchange factor 5 [Choanephora cucurbitarum]|uniref:Rap guanine nucleotide exchange factor 5 n=1 Tax=Choanephora cucurbitarum TaxID=101091 RepID=A0A1C7ND88_9FUNG|nr:Rap guanine nucleotide exchange factor 5 [Choanephora cucurbitarum]